MNDDLLDRLLGDHDGGARLLLVHGSRGAGKTWWMDRAAARAAAAGFALTRVEARHEQVEPARLAAFAAVVPACLVVDDLDLLDPSVRRSVRAVVEASGGVVIASASFSGAFDGALPIRIEPMSTTEVEQLLRGRGVAPRAAQRCALAAAGNPGLAISLADGLSDAQRGDEAGVPELPRLATDVATVLHDRLQRLGERTCRALVVAAADDDGDLGAIRTALRALGEASNADDSVEDPLAGVFDDAELAGVVDIVGARVLFTDPWLRLAAYHLVAPASRRAAHRALAAAYSAPRQGEARVRHLVGASNGPSDTVAEALMTVAAAAARRGERLSAARLAAQGAELSVSAEIRSACLLRAAGWWVDIGDLHMADQLIGALDGATDEERAATAEVNALLHGEPEANDSGRADPSGTGDDGYSGHAPASERTLASWGGRRRQRQRWWKDAAAGRHAPVLQQVGSAAAPGELLARAVALRHGGFVRDAVEVVERTLSTLPSHDHQLGRHWALLAADLAVLTARTGPGVVDGDGSASWRAVGARAAAAVDPAVELGPAIIEVPTGSPLAEVRTLLLRGLTTHDVGLLTDAAAGADAANLPVEAGEAWLFAAEIAARHGGERAQRDVAQFVRHATERLHRCAVRGWDARLQRLSERHVVAAAAPADAAGAPDPALEALSAAEWRVASAVAGGLTNREVASTLFLSVKTVDFHLQQIYRKLALRSRTELAVRVAGHAQHSVGRSAPGTKGAVR